MNTNFSTKNIIFFFCLKWYPWFKKLITPLKEIFFEIWKPSLAAKFNFADGDVFYFSQNLFFSTTYWIFWRRFIFFQHSQNQHTLLFFWNKIDARAQNTDFDAYIHGIYMDIHGRKALDLSVILAHWLGGKRLLLGIYDFFQHFVLKWVSSSGVPPIQNPIL